MLNPLINGIINLGDHMNNYIKLNNNNNHLSLGNLFNIIKKISINKSSAIQTEIFCTLFSIDNISETTVGNYCTGYRAIGNDYKQIYLNYKKHYQKDEKILIPTINNLLSIIDGYIYDYKEIKELNNNSSLNNLCHNLNPLVKNDLYIPSNLKKTLSNYLNKEKYYNFICEALFFIILEKKQPLYEIDLVNETIEEILNNTNMSINDLKKYLEIKFKEGISYIPSLKKLAEKGNPYCLHELGNLEYTGTIAGYPRYEEAYKYYLNAASFNHPTANWMIAHMLINKKIGSLNDDDINLAWEYLNKAYSLGSISAINTIGLCYLNGYTENHKKDIDKAIKYFKEAISKNYIYAYNNLGKIYEDKKDYENAYLCYKKSALSEESWACNRLGLFYYNGIYVKKDINKAFEYFTIGANSPIMTRDNWNIYNLVKLFYLKGNGTIGIKKNINKCLELLNTINNFEPANELFLYCYYELYLENKEKQYLDKINYYLNIVNTNDIKIKKDIEKELDNIYRIQIKL